MDNDNKKLFVVGKYQQIFNAVLDEPLQYTQIYQSEGLLAHIKKRHKNCLIYYDKIPEIISSPDYIGVNPNEKDTSLELVKCYDENILIGIKIDRDNDYVFVSTMHEISQSKINNKLYSGRLKRYKEIVDKY